MFEAWEASSYCCIINHPIAPKFSGVKQFFFNVHGFCGCGIQKEHSGEKFPLLQNVCDVLWDDANGRGCLKWRGAGRARLEDPLQRWPLHSQEWLEHPTHDLSSMARYLSIIVLSPLWLKAPRTCVSRNQGRATSFVMAQPQKSQVYQRIYSHASNWHSSCENSDATN